MKKLFTAFIALTMIFTLAACGKTAGAASPDISSPAETDDVSDVTPVPGETLDPEAEYPLLVPASESVSADLNGDGKKDVVSYVSEGADPEYWYMIGSLTINDVDFTEAIYDMGYYSDSPDTEYYAICDIDESDDMLEIALLDWGPSDDLVTNFFRYDGENIVFLGRVTGILYNSYADKYELSFDGKGTISSYLRLSPFQTWFAPVDWVLGENGFEVVPQEVFYSPQENEIVTLADISAYSEMSLDSERVPVPVGTTLVAIGTDNENWVLTKNLSGDECWIYLIDGYQVETSAGNQYCWDIFDGLTLYD